jgi:UPF0755 protein
MISARMLSWLAGVGALLLTLLAAWLIIGSPGTVDEPAAYEPQPEPGEPVAVTVEEGDSPTDIAEKLELAGAIDSGTRFRVLVQLMGYDRLLQAGTYELARGTPALDVIYRMRNGVVSPNSVTVIEGWQLEEIADAVAALGVSREDFLAAANTQAYNYTWVHIIPDGESLEGYLYPATYSIRATDSGGDVVLEMLRGFDANIPVDDIRAREEETGLTLHEVLTIASIIEREAVIPEERPIMAQVFLSRLEAEMTLGADPTVQYALAQVPGNVAQYGYWKQELTVDDLNIDSPYNTYQNAGLPPGPICNPSAASIDAVMNPADTNYLYFVAKGDGSHAFAETEAEHDQNIAEFLNQ